MIDDSIVDVIGGENLKMNIRRRSPYSDKRAMMRWLTKTVEECGSSIV